MVMSILGAHPGANLICNGIKDTEYMELVGWRWEGSHGDGRGCRYEPHRQAPLPHACAPRCCAA